MIGFYKDVIKKGLIKIEEIPEKYRQGVETLLENNI